MGWFIFGIILILIGIGVLSARRPLVANAGMPSAIHSGIVATCFLVAAGCLFASIFYTIEPKEVGVVKTYGKIADETAKSGPHFKAPWSDVIKVDGGTKVDEYFGKSAIKVTMSDGNTAKIGMTIRWAVDENKANAAVKEYKTDDVRAELRKSVVSTQFKSATMAEFINFDPMSMAGTGAKPDLKSIGERIAQETENRSEGLVQIKSVTISDIDLGERAQRTVNDLITQRSETRVAVESQATAKAKAEANKILAESISKDPNVLVAECLGLIKSGDLKLPAGSSCWPGGNSAVVLPSTN